MRQVHLHRPGTIAEAVALLESHAPDAAPLAGGTWVMRAPMRGEGLPGHSVSLHGLAELHGVARSNGGVRIGALVTHAEIGGIADGAGPLGALAEAARRSAFPAVRNVATLGGNLAAPFPEADLVPPLLAADAQIDFASPRGSGTVDIATLLEMSLPSDEVIVAVRIPAPPGRRSWFERLTVRAGAEYSLASVAVALDHGTDGEVQAARVAVGAVESVPTRVTAAEEALTGAPLDAEAIEGAAAAAAGGLTGRDRLEAPGWYRVAVVPALVRRALARLTKAEARAG